MKIYAIAIAAILLAGCDDSPIDYSIVYEYRIRPENREAAAAWVQKTVEAANPHSDEEPEDNIAQAEATADRLFGSQVPCLRIHDPNTYRLDIIAPWDLSPAHRGMYDVLLGRIEP